MIDLFVAITVLFGTFIVSGMIFEFTKMEHLCTAIIVMDSIVTVLFKDVIIAHHLQYSVGIIIIATVILASIHMTIWLVDWLRRMNSGVL
jgi:hypothetical protein